MSNLAADKMHSLTLSRWILNAMDDQKMRHHSVFPREQLLTNGTSGLSLMDGLVMCKWIIAAENFATLVAHIFCWTAWGCCRSCRKPSTWLFIYPLSNYRDRKSSILHHITIKQKHWPSNNCCWRSVYSMFSKCFHLSGWGANCKRAETGITPLNQLKSHVIIIVRLQ